MKNHWHEQNGVIDFTLPATDGTTGPQWIKRLQQRGIQIETNAKPILRYEFLNPTVGVVNRVKVLKGRLFPDNEYYADNIRASAYAGTFTQGQKLFDPNPEVVCLILEMFTDEEIEKMGLRWIIAMHHPFNNSEGGPGLLGVYRDYSSNGTWLRAIYGEPADKHYRRFRERGFAFVDA